MGAVGSLVLNRFRVPPPQSPAQPRPAWLAAAALGLAAVALGTVVWRRTRSRRRRRLQQVGTVAQLWIYPVKSCKGVAVSEAECTAFGLRQGHLRDRYSEVLELGVGVGGEGLHRTCWGWGGAGKSRILPATESWAGQGQREKCSHSSQQHTPESGPAFPGWPSFHPFTYVTAEEVWPPFPGASQCSWT